LFGSSDLSQERREAALDADRSEVSEVFERDHEGIRSQREISESRVVYQDAFYYDSDTIILVSSLSLPYILSYKAKN
jgi:hypothetical protein